MLCNWSGACMHPNLWNRLQSLVNKFPKEPPVSRASFLGEVPQFTEMGTLLQPVSSPLQSQCAFASATETFSKTMSPCSINGTSADGIISFFWNRRICSQCWLAPCSSSRGMYSTKNDSECPHLAFPPNPLVVGTWSFLHFLKKSQQPEQATSDKKGGGREKRMQNLQEKID